MFPPNFNFFLSVTLSGLVRISKTRSIFANVVAYQFIPCEQRPFEGSIDLSAAIPGGGGEGGNPGDMGAWCGICQLCSLILNPGWGIGSLLHFRNKGRPAGFIYFYILFLFLYNFRKKTTILSMLMF